MPFAHSFEPENSLLSIVGEGDVSIQDRTECVQDILSDSSLPDKCNILLDIGLVSNDPRPEDAQQMVYLIKRLQERFRGNMAILTLPTRHVTLTHLLAASSSTESRKVKAFMSVDGAKQWLQMSK